MPSTFYIDWDTEQSSSIENVIEDEQSFEIDNENLDIQEVLKKGLFSTIHKGMLKNGQKTEPVVIKSASNSKDGPQTRMIIDELEVLIDIKKHPNILGFLGFIKNQENQASIVSEYVEGGSLLKYLRNHAKCKTFRHNLEEKEDNIFILIESPPEYIHRQLTLRCIFITSDKTIRIGDLGLARKNEAGHYYRILNKNMPLPFHWMAPEAFDDHKFTEKSDVWSFGVCLYEIFSLGKTVYEGVQDVLTFLKKGRRLPKPEYCSQEIYDFMLTCWDLNPDKRPTFAECAGFFERQTLILKSETVKVNEQGNNQL